MFVIVASSAKSDIESKGCVCLTKVDKIETYFDKQELHSHHWTQRMMQSMN